MFLLIVWGKIFGVFFYGDFWNVYLFVVSVCVFLWCVGEYSVVGEFGYWDGVCV